MRSDIMTSIFNVSQPLTLESQAARLRAENQALVDELSQCQADKEFVWSLWKRLQLASPDITQAIGMVIQREKEKAEQKDQKVLDILQMKDNKIEELQKVVNSHTKEVGHLLTIKLELQSDVGRLKTENEGLRDECQTLREKLNEKENRDAQIASRQAIREMDRDILDMKQQLGRRERELSDLTADKEDLLTVRDSQRDRIGNLEEDIQDVGTKYDKLSKEYKDASNLLRDYEAQLSTQQRDLEDKTRELDGVRRELSELWLSHSQTSDHTSQQADLIQQLRALQQDTHSMMKTQENAHSHEATSLQEMYRALRDEEIELQQTVHKQQNQLQQQEQVICDQRRRLESLGVRTTGIQTSFAADDQESDTTEPDSELEHRLVGLQSELDAIRGHISHPPGGSTIRGHMSHPPGGSTLRSRGRSLDKTRSRSLTAKGRSRSEPRSRARSRSLKRLDSRYFDAKTLLRNLGHLQQKLSDVNNLLRLKDGEVEEVRAAHNRRLERLRALQSDHRLVKKQLRLVENDSYGPRRKKRRFLRADPKSLQKENSDSVWNELGFFRNENQNMKVQLMNLQEEMDGLKVQTSQDSATIYELRSCLDQEREELQFLTEQQEQSSPPTPPQAEVDLKKARREIRKLEKQIQTIQDDNRSVAGEREGLLADRRDLKRQLSRLQQRDSDGRIKMADLNNEMHRLQRELKKNKTKGRSTVSKHYQRKLNCSIHQMKNVFDDFTADGWEEVSDTEEAMQDTSDLTGTAESLGQAIADHADRTLQSDLDLSDPLSPRQPRLTGRQIDSMRTHVKRLAKPSGPPPRNRPIVTAPPSVVRRDIGLSPIRFYDSHSRSPSHSPTRPRYPDRPMTASVGTSPARPRYSERPMTASVGTSPVLAAQGKKYQAPNTVLRQVATLKQRVQSLQHQISLLRSSRDIAVTKSHEQKDAINQLQSELSSANQKLQSSRLTAQRLTSDLDRLRGDKEALEAQLEDYSIGTDSTAGGWQRSEQEWTALQARLKSTTNEASKQLSQLKTLRAENTELKERTQTLQDRLNHTERDVNQKRTLLEDMRIKLRFAQENAQTDAEVMTEVDVKLRNLSEANSRYKTQVDSLRQRLSAVTKEKHQHDEKVFKLSEEVERKSKQASDMQRKNAELQSTVIAIEKAAQDQLHALANQSEAVIDNAHSRLGQATDRLQEHDKFIKVFSHAMINSLQQSRSLWQQQKQRKKVAEVAPPSGTDMSLRRAQTLACDILNISQSDLDDIMSVNEGSAPYRAQAESSESPEEIRKDKKWAKKIEKLPQNKKDFSLQLMELFMEKVEERCKMSAKLQNS